MATDRPWSATPAAVNERPLSSTVEVRLDGQKWVGVTARYFHSVASSMTSTVSSGMSHIGK